MPYDIWGRPYVPNEEQEHAKANQRELDAERWDKLIRHLEVTGVSKEEIRELIREIDRLPRHEHQVAYVIHHIKLGIKQTHG